MIIEIPKIGPDGSLYEGDEDATVVGLDGAPGVRPKGPLRYRLFAQIASRRLIVSGRVDWPVSLQCGRCACFFSTSASDSSFLRDYALRDGQVEVDVTDDLREAVLLALPNHPLCRESCAGRCPQCGKNLNSGRCGCRPPDAPGVWSGLDGLKLDGG
jgi:uncharacterized protein